MADPQSYVLQTIIARRVNDDQHQHQGDWTHDSDGENHPHSIRTPQRSTQRLRCFTLYMGQTSIGDTLHHPKQQAFFQKNHRVNHEIWGAYLWSYSWSYHKYHINIIWIHSCIHALQPGYGNISNISILRYRSKPHEAIRSMVGMQLTNHPTSQLWRCCHGEWLITSMALWGLWL